MSKHAHVLRVGDLMHRYFPPKKNLLNDKDL